MALNQLLSPSITQNVYMAILLSIYHAGTLFHLFEFVNCKAIISSLSFFPYSYRDVDLDFIYTFL